MFARLFVSAALGLAVTGCAASALDTPRTRSAGLVSPRLERFESESAFLQYLRDARRETRRNGGWWAGRIERRPNGAIENEEEEAIVVTGSRLVRQDFEALAPVTTVGAEQLELTATMTTDSLLNELPQSITNNQERGVDEGDIVKRIGRFLIVLQDGRLFTVDLLPAGAPGLRFVDRENVYRSAADSDWIDEMLVFGRRVLVTGYSYQLDATEVSIFVLSDEGQLTREGVYYISSSDYYDSENYATRIVGDNLVFYTPLNLRYVDPDLPLKFPLIRRWVRDEEREVILSDGETLFDARDIYRPLQFTTEPTVYTVSICPLGAALRGDELNCRSTAFVAPSERVVYVSPEHVYLWASPGWGDLHRRGSDGCHADTGDVSFPDLESTLYQIPLFGGPLRALRVRGAPPNQFAMAAAGGELRALLQHQCDDTRLSYFHTPLRAFRRDRPLYAQRERYVSAPGVDAGRLEVRFTEDFVVYGEQSEWGSWPPDEAAPVERAHSVIALPTANPMGAISLEVPHGLIRIERLGDDMVLTGYRNRRGLNVSRLDLTERLHVSDTFLLEGRFETEGRSHAFNARLDTGGGGLIGLPTAGATGEASRRPWESEDSDVTFLTFDATGRFEFAGTLARGSEPQPAYTCEVSCVDWYGNARPIFLGGRIFALTGAHLVEGVLQEGRVRESWRLDLTAMPQ